MLRYVVVTAGVEVDVVVVEQRQKGSTERRGLPSGAVVAGAEERVVSGDDLRRERLHKGGCV